MIETLEIRNFKSIKELRLPCKRFNLFIGEPGAGKSNLLEALGLLSFIEARQYDPDMALDGFVRHEGTANLFYAGDTAHPLSIDCGAAAVELELAGQGGQYRGVYRHSAGATAALSGDEGAIREVAALAPAARPPVRFYRAPALTDFREADCAFLLPPAGSNFPSLLARDGELRHAVNLSFAGSKLKPVLRPGEKRIELVKEGADGGQPVPYALASPSRQRLSFYTAAMETNRGAALVFPEPESHCHPGDIHFLAERIAWYGNGNQYFITTNNPYLLLNLLEKTPRAELAVNAVYARDCHTQVLTLSAADLAALSAVDFFANLHWVLES